MAKQFKDFNKETKDLLSKNYPAPGAWKVETKDKAADRLVVLNATADFSAKKSSLAVDVDYNVKEYNLKTKTNVNVAGNVKPKVTYEPCKGHKVETTLMSLSADSDFEITYEGELAPGVVCFDKVTKKQAEGQVSYTRGPFAIGGSVTWAFNGGFKGWSAGARFVDKLATVNVVTKDLKTFTTGVYAPLKISGTSVKLAAQVDCGSGKFAGNFGVEAPVNVAGKALTLKVKTDNEMKCFLSVATKFAQAWTAVFAVSLQDVTKVGVQLTRE